MNCSWGITILRYTGQSKTIEKFINIHKNATYLSRSSILPLEVPPLWEQSFANARQKKCKEKHLCLSLFLIESLFESPCEICYIFKNTLFAELLRWLLMKYLVKTSLALDVRMLYLQIRRLCMAAAYQVFNGNWISICEYVFTIYGDLLGFYINCLKVLVKDLTLCSIYRSIQALWKIHGIA